MYNIPIFDSCTHPTINGQWNFGRADKLAAREDLVKYFTDNNIQWSFAIGLEGVGDYRVEEYVSFVKNFIPNALPVAFVKPDLTGKSSTAIRKTIQRIKSLGYKGIKLHPRLGSFTLDNKYLPVIIKEANDLELVVLLCTYFYSNRPGSHMNNSNQVLLLLEKMPEEKMILMHSGGVHLLEYVEIARSFPSVLLDLSFTILKYMGSSLDLDLEYVINSFDQRVCIGSDYPDFTPAMLRSRFNNLVKGVDHEKIKNIAFRNLLNFLDITNHEIITE